MSPRSRKYEQKRPFAEKYFLEQFRQARLASTLYMALGNILFILNLPAFATNKRIHGVLPFPWKQSDTRTYLYVYGKIRYTIWENPDQESSS